MNELTPPTYDVAVLGGGPAGAIAATHLAQRGRRVLVLERDRFPRFHIGESLLATCNDAFAAVGLTDKVRAAGYQVKWGATFITHDGSHDRYADFSASRELAEPQTWQVERARFDRMLLTHAAEAGAEVREEHRVLTTEFDASGVTVTARDAAGASHRFRAAAVIDASGRAGLLSRQLGLRREDPQLPNIAVYAHFRGVPPLEGRRRGDIRIVARHDAGWFWVIPISDELMSVGVVLPKPLFDRLPRGSHEGMLRHAVAETPVMAELMRQAELVWEARVEKEFSYSTSAYAGDRWLLAGDSGSFLDPVFSSGVAIALESGLEAARAADQALTRGDLSARSFRRFDARQRARYEAFRRFVLAFYTPSFRDLFFQPAANPAFFRAVVTVLGGRWRPTLPTRMLIAIFFAIVRLQDRFDLAPRIYPKGEDGRARLAGAPGN